MSASGYLLYFTTVLIWGSTWFGIKFQLGEVDPLISVAYRFGLAALLLFIWCVLARARLRLTTREHGALFLQGVCLFCINYWLIYWSEVYLTSGIVAVLFSSLVFLNIFNARIFLKRPLAPKVLAGATLGMSGVALLFYPEFRQLSLEDDAVKGLLFGFGSTYVASLGNIIATRNSALRLPVISVNAWGMFYGTVVLVLAALISGTEFRYPGGFAFTASLLYLAVFGSIVAFGAYLRLLATIGPDRAGYTSMLIPVVALLVSTFFEGFVWTVPALMGIVLISAGNVLSLRR